MTHAFPSWTAGVRREVLPNGLTLLVQRDASAPAVAVVTHVKAGFFDEPDRWAGISHVLEHMFFKGTPTRGVGAIARETKLAGGYLNASTGYDHTAYFTVLPAGGLEAAVEIQADALRRSVIDADELARELQVIIQEAKRKLDTASAVTYETLYETMFDRHRIRRWRIGREADLAGFTRDDVLGYYRSRYVPARTIVAIVGALDIETALALARRHYGDWPAAPGAHDPSPEEPRRIEVRARTLRGDVAQAELALGWRTVPPLHADSAALDLAAAALAQGRGSRLWRALRETGLATGVSAHNYAPTELGVFGITAEFEANRQGRVLEAIASEVARLTLVGPTADELDRTRTLLLTRWARRMESMEGRAAALAAAEALADIGLLDREFAAIGAATADIVREASARYLQPDAVSGVVFLPDREGEELTAESLGRAFAVTPLSAEGLRPACRAARPAPVRTRTTTRVEADVHHTALPGADLLVRRKEGVPTVTLGLYVPRGDPEEPARAGIGALAMRTALRGAGDLDAAGLAFAAERLGGAIGPVAGTDWLGVGTTVLAERMGEAAGLLDLVRRYPRLADDAVATERAMMIEEALQVTDDMFRFPFQLAFRAAFGDSDYGLPLYGLPETLRDISAEDIRRWHAAAVAEPRAVVVAVGDIDPARATDELAAVFGALAARTDGNRRAAVRWVPVDTPAVQVVERQKAQAAFAMAFPGPGRRSPRRFAAEVWAAVASGLGGRLFEALRDRRSLAYTVMASAWARGRGGALLTYIATSPEREEEARAAMLEELAGFARAPAGEEELTRARNYLAGQAEVQRQSGGVVAGEILEAWLTGDGLAELEDPAAGYRAVRADDVLALAAECLDPSRRAEGVVRGSGGRR